MRSPARICLACLVLAACGGDDGDASKGGDESAKEAPAKPTLRQAAAWKAGAWMAYRATRSADAKEGAKPDESAHFDYFFMREIKGVATEGETLVVTVVERGGIEKPKTRKWVVDDTCVRSGPTTLFCLPEGGGDPEATRVGELDVKALTYEDAKTGLVTHFDPQIGLVQESVLDKRGRQVTHTLAGWEGPGGKGGKARFEPLSCDWDSETRGGKKLGSKADPDGAIAARAKAAGLQEDALKRTTLRMDDVHGAKSVEVLYDEKMAQITVFGKDAKTVLHSHPSAGKPGRVKAWTDPAKGFQLIAITLEHAESSAVELLRVKDGTVERTGYNFPSVTAKTDRLDVHLMADPEACVLRVRHQTAEGVKVADMGLTAPGYERLRGTLALSE